MAPEALRAARPAAGNPSFGETSGARSCGWASAGAIGLSGANRAFSSACNGFSGRAQRSPPGRRGLTTRASATALPGSFSRQERAPFGQRRPASPSERSGAADRRARGALPGRAPRALAPCAPRRNVLERRRKAAGLPGRETARKGSPPSSPVSPPGRTGAAGAKPYRKGTDVMPALWIETNDYGTGSGFCPSFVLSQQASR